ncbi:mandelate racemase/muconate lactonizing enzyme family protein [Psychromicrobium lacuslunae]|uniref:mandelate racemase/muconate lactonizing enzyme family protein n=1 Tax=Psychromicrobium lacuslunae TaxID=1618207 RepID=UPI0022772637|nr:enolase C-terminal domain-like protein [Psychromicrobium lacuslunae]
MANPFTTAVRSATELETVLVRLMDAEGRSAWGETPVSKVTGVSAEASIRGIEGPLRELLQAAPSLDEALVALQLSEQPAAIRSAVDCALHDLRAQQAGEPLARQLGAQSLRVRTDMTLSVAEASELVPKAVALIEQGFGCLKIKIDAQHDAVTALREVRRAVGPRPVLRADANQAFEVAEAIRVIRELEDSEVNLSLVEQPVVAADLPGLAEVSRAVETPVMADESIWTMSDLLELLRLRAAPMVNIKLAKTGGLSQAVEMLNYARAEGLRVVIGCMLESHVGISAAATLAALLPEDDQDLDGGLWLRESPILGGAEYRGSQILLSDAPGLGISGVRGLTNPLGE